MMGLAAVPVMETFVPAETEMTPVLETIGSVEVPVIEIPVPAVRVSRTPEADTTGFCGSVLSTDAPVPAVTVRTPVLLTMGLAAVPVMEMPGPAVIVSTTPPIPELKSEVLGRLR